jgi:hypothetical protein
MLCKENTMSDWSDSKKWRMDLLKSAITFSVAALVTLFVVDKIQVRRSFENAQASAYYAERVKALVQLQSETVLYDRSAHTAYTELFQWNSRQKTPAMVEYEQVAYPRWQLVLESAEYLFPNCAGAIQLLRASNDQRHEIYHRFVYTQIDLKHEITPEWQDKRRNELWAERPEFEKLEKTMATRRVEIVNGIQRTLFPVAKKKSSSDACSSG